MTLSINTRIAAIIIAAAVGTAGAALANPATDEHSEVAALESARTAPADAVRAAEARTGGRAVEMGLEKKGTAAAYYEVLVAMPAGISEVHLDPSTGAVQSASKPGSLAVEGVRPDQVAQVTAAPVTLADAITAAEQKAGGRTLEAGYAFVDGKAMARVEVAASGGLQQVTIDAHDASKATLAAASDGDGESAAD